MTISRFAGDRFTGLSTDTKPTNILDGALFTELDTGKTFIYYSSEWVEQSVSDEYTKTMALLGY